MDRASYLQTLFPSDDTLEQISRSIESAGLPRISVKPEIGHLITLLVSSIQAKQALEIGTLGGYSGTCIARGLSAGGKLTSLELKEEHAALARHNLELAGFEQQVNILLGEALHSLERLQAEQRQFDFIFIDADKPNYLHYLQFALQLSHVGTLIVADNVFLSDRVIDPNNQSPGPVAMRQFNETLFANAKLQSTILPVYDGIAIARVIQ